MSYKQSDYYQILGIQRDASAGEIEEAFERLQARSEEEQNEAAEADSSIVLHAYEVLSNSERRNLYDSLLAETQAPHLTTDVKLSSPHITVLDIPQILYLLVELRSQDNNIGATLPLNLCIVLDRSSSMRGERLDQVKNALQMLLDKLSPGDVISVVSFSDRAEIVLPSRPVGQHQEPIAKIQGIQATGGTEIFQGLSAGVQQMRSVVLNDYYNHLVLLTDGHTYGDAEQCLHLAAKVAEEGIVLNAFGIGADWDDQFLDALVAPSNGLAQYIDAPQTIVASLGTRLKSVGATFARHVRLREKWPRWVTLLDSFRLTPFAKPLTSEDGYIELGDIEGRAPLILLLELSIAPHPIETRIRIPLTFVAEIPGQGEQTFEEQIQITILAKAPMIDPPPDLVRAVRLLTLYRLNEKVWQEVELGQLDNAAMRMHHLSTRFLEVGESSLANQANVEARRLSRSGTLSPEGRKRLKYGTRTLMRETIQLEWDDSV
ncbi:MAG: VWA domain-containing protein [Chloroflexi bacterium]|jgi:Ca-activated chloride channel family protein|nr:VWA domain-containing protein [Chloroflexota bacterium]